MRRHLSSAENYHTLDGYILEIYYYNPITNDRVYECNDEALVKYDISFKVSFEDKDCMSSFFGGDPSPKKETSDHWFVLTVVSENSKILYQNGFYDHISIGDRIRVTTSSFIYMDSFFFYIAAIEYNGTVYLDFDDGLENIVDMMNENKSLL